ncbi:MAG: response regulator [Planctomycetaceae bacterium]|nr:response regulator [Planctomycetales bacterium]MCB9924729.1 response regulator [Planctomycetaceae bacterium]
MDEPIKILLVEDNSVDIKAVERAFRARKISNPIYVAHDGLEALDILRGANGKQQLHQPYVVLLDLNMPRMGGLEFLHEIRDDSVLKRSIVFVLTTSEDDRDKTAAYDKQVAGYLSKYDAGGEFLNVIQLLEQFQVSVHFPPKSDC